MSTINLDLFKVRQSRECNCNMVQLTTNKERDLALQFYERLGFIASHQGLKLQL